MIRLVLLLLGARTLRPFWIALLALGLTWLVLGTWLLVNLTSREIVYIEDTLAIFIALEGTVRVLHALALGLRQYWGEFVRGLCFLLAGFLVFNVQWDHNMGATIVFGAAFLADGFLRIGSAYVLRGRRLRNNLIYGFISVLLALLILLRWPLPYEVTVAFCLALLFLSSGFVLVSAALQLHRLPPGGSVTSLPIYSNVNWQARGIAVPLLEFIPAPMLGELNVRVWTATGSITDPERRLLVDRYVAAVDRKGVVSTGHSALEIPGEMYISHYPAVELDHSPDELQSILHSGPKNDVTGRFQPSLAVETTAWCPPDQTVRFHRFNKDALLGFWQLYSTDNTYNLTARNCSTTVVSALDAATEGLASHGNPLRDVLLLLLNPDFWILRLIRGRAEAMTWTPGLVLDYAVLLNKVLEHGDRRWRRRFASAFSAKGTRSK